MPDLTYDLMSVQAVTLQKKRVSVQLLASAVDASLPAFAAVRPAALSAGQQLVAITCAQGSQQQTYHVLLQQANGTDRRTDGRLTVS